jgi:hypothetical protein
MNMTGTYHDVYAGALIAADAVAHRRTVSNRPRHCSADAVLKAR